MQDDENNFMRGLISPALAALVVILTVGVVAIARLDAPAPAERSEHDADALAGTPVERTKSLTVDASANVEVRYSASMRHLLARCVNTTTGVSLFVVESGAANTTSGLGPFCDTCAGGATLPPLGTAYLRTSAGTATVRCGFVEDWPTAGVSFTGPGAGGMSTTTADASYLRLDATNDPVTGSLELGANVTFGDAAADTVTSNAATWTLANDTNIAISGGVNGLSVDGATFSVDGAGNQVGIGTAAPGAALEVLDDENRGSQVYVVNANAGNLAAAAMYLLTENAPYSGGRYAGLTVNGTGYTVDANQKGDQFAFFTQSGLTNGIFFRTDAANAPIVFGVSASNATGHQLQAEKLRIGSTAVTFNGGNSDVDFIVDSDAEEAAFSVDGATTANLVLDSGDTCTLTATSFKPGATDATSLGTAAAQWDEVHVDSGATGDPSVAIGAGDTGFYSTASTLQAVVAGQAMTGWNSSGFFSAPAIANALGQFKPGMDLVGGWLYVDSNTSDPAAADCDAAGEIGRMRWQETSQRLFVCDGADGWRGIASVAP